MADPLNTLRRLRRLAVDEARLALADCIREALSADTEAAAAQRTLERETAAAAQTAPGQGDYNRDEYVAWLGVARANRAALELRRDATARRTEAARVELAASRSAAEAVQELMARRDAASAADRAREEQRALDDIASRIGMR
jgi:flagellar biosynthesis chaperone FliJ